MNGRQVKKVERRDKYEKRKAEKEKLWRMRNEVNEEVKVKIKSMKEREEGILRGVREILLKEYLDFYPEWKKFNQKLKKKKARRIRCK
jgi:hypothetical protein